MMTATTSEASEESTFELSVLGTTSKQCSVCQQRPGWYEVVFGGNLKVRYCWNCLPSEQRHYLRVNY